LPAGAAMVVVERIGYSSDSLRTLLAAATPNHMELGLALAPVVLARLHATAEALPRSFQLRDFYIRKATWGSGYFIDRRRIAEQRGARFSELMRLIPNAHLITDPNNQQTYLRFNKVYSTQRGGCAPTYYLDGQLYPVARDADVDREFSPEEIEGIEVYTGALVPPQFNGSRALCGVVVIWTRDH
ncbi:MAG TPA: Plug domain-containing protein, partial [Longimicrobiaceae bacterium]